MKYVFEDEEKRTKLKTILDEWLGTPFRHRTGVKGLGCDCIHFVAGVYEEMNLLSIPKNAWPDYPKDWHLHNTRELLVEGIQKYLSVERVESRDFMDGDLLVYKFGKAAAHAGIYFGGYVYQAVDPFGVQKVLITLNPFSKRLIYVFRLVTWQQ